MLNTSCEIVQYISLLIRTVKQFIPYLNHSYQSHPVSGYKVNYTQILKSIIFYYLTNGPAMPVEVRKVIGHWTTCQPVNSSTQTVANVGPWIISMIKSRTMQRVHREVIILNSGTPTMGWMSTHKTSGPKHNRHYRSTQTAGHGLLLTNCKYCFRVPAFCFGFLRRYFHASVFFYLFCLLFHFWFI